MIKRITQRLNSRNCRVAASPDPSDRKRTQRYFERYVFHLSAAGEMVQFDRSSYNRAGVERVMGFCTDAQCADDVRHPVWPDVVAPGIYRTPMLEPHRLLEVRPAFKAHPRAGDRVQKFKCASMQTKSWRPGRHGWRCVQHVAQNRMTQRLQMYA